MHVLAIDIGGTKTAVALMNDDDVLEHATWPSLPTADEAIARIVETCTPWADQAEAIGVSFGGPFDFTPQTCVRSMHRTGWDNIALSAELERALGLPTVTDNDANVAALGEYARANSRDHGTHDNRTLTTDPMLYVTLSTGVGAAIVANGQLLRGAHSLAGELGHFPLGHDKVCSCGQVGCLERVVSGHWIEHDHGIPAIDYLSDDDNYDAWLANLTHALWACIVLIDPALIVLGGGMTTQGDRLIDPLRSAIDERAERSQRTPPTIRKGDSSGRTVLAGAAIMAAQHAAQHNTKT